MFARNSSASALAAYVARQQERVPVVVNEFQPGDEGETLVFSHAIDGTAWMAFSVARTELAPGRRILGLSVAGPDVLDQGPRPISELVPEYARMVRDVSPGPYVVAGHSLGAHIGAATANALIAQGGSVPVLVVIDDDAELTRRSFGAAGRSPAARTVLAFFRHAVDLSPLAPYPGPVVLIRCEEDDADYRSDRTAGWGEIALGGVRDIVLPGNHNSLVREDSLPTLVPVLLTEVDAARGEGPSGPFTTDPMRALRYEARVARAEGRLADEIAHWRDAVASDPDQPSWVYENLAVALFSAHEDDSAYRALDEALERDPWPLSIVLRFAPQWADAGRSTRRPETRLRAFACASRRTTHRSCSNAGSSRRMPGCRARRSGCSAKAWRWRRTTTACTSSSATTWPESTGTRKPPGSSGS